MKTARALAMIAVALAACATRQHGSPVPRPRVIPHGLWQAQPPLGYAADATRRNIGANGSLSFRDFKIDVLGTTVIRPVVRPSMSYDGTFRRMVSERLGG
jgi:hypothetical protein